MPVTILANPHDLNGRAIKPDRSLIDKRLMRRARNLNILDRAIFDLVLVQSIPRRYVAALLGLSEGTISRRIRKIKNLLYDKIVVLLTSDCFLSAELREVGLDYFLRRKPITHIAQARHMSRYQINAYLIACREILQYRLAVSQQNDRTVDKNASQ